MQFLLKKRCLFGFIIILLHTCFACWNPIGLQGADIFWGHTSRAFAMDSQAAFNNAIDPDQNLTFQNRLDIYEFFVGIMLSVLGIAAVAISLLRWKAKDLLVISFGLFSLLYGARTNAFRYLFDISPIFWEYLRWFITYLVPIPAYIFVEQLIGRGWKSSIRILLYCQIFFSLTAIFIGIYSNKPSTAFVGNNIFAIAFLLVIFINLFRPSHLPHRELRILRFGFVVLAVFSFHGNFAPFVLSGPFSQNYEAVGLLFFYCCIGYVVAHHFFRNEKNLFALNHELETARQIQSFILPQEMVKIQGLEITARYVPMATVAGDLYDFIIIDDKRLGILVADVSGHGVPASLIASMVKIAFVSQTPHASDPARVLAGVNRILCGKLESDFVTAGYLYIDTGQQTASYVGAGHPPLLLWRRSEQKIFEFRTKGIILGQFEEARYETVVLNYDRGDRFFLYTDGIVEASNMAGDFFGWDRFKEYIVSNSGLPANIFSDKLIEDLTRWSAKGSTATLDDDLTLVVVDVASAAK